MAQILPAFAKAAIVFSSILLTGIAALSGAHAHDLRQIGDGKYSDSPKRGYLYSCQTRFNPNAPGASGTGPWIEGNSFNPSRKPTVDGNVMWPNAKISVTREGDLRVIRANNLPTHPTGIFPVRSGDDAYRYDRNPNSIREQNILLRLPSDPQVATSPTCVPMGMIGFSVGGGAIYNALDARGRDAPAYEILDRCGGHPQKQGQYHYHDLTPCMPGGLDGSGHGELIGYVLDGFGIFGPAEASGQLVTNADLDACHGHIGPVMWDGEKRSIFHYHMTDQYPYSVGCFRGKPTSVPSLATLGSRPPEARGARETSKSGAMRKPPSGSQAGGRGGEVLQAVARDLGVDADALRRAVGPPLPDLRRASQTLGVSMQQLR